MATRTAKPKETQTIRQTVTFSAPPEAIFKSLADPKIHSAFTGAKATGQAKVGAKVTAHDGYIKGRILAVVPGKKIVQEWVTEEWPEGYPPSRLAFSLTKTPSGTRLTMVQSKVPASQAARYSSGWLEYYWTPLKTYLAEK